MNNDVIKVQLSCGVDYYKGEKGDKPVKGVDYFTQEDIAEIVEQIETGGIDLDDYATKEYVDSAVEGVVVSETDPTVPQWAKQPNKPSYTANEVGALPADTQLFSGNYNDLRNKPTIPTVPSNVSAFTNDAGYLTSHQSLTDYATKAYVDDAIENIDTSGAITVETDPTVPSWAKQANKPTYTAQEVGALPANTALFSGDYNDLSNKPTLTPVPIVIQATIAGQPSVVDGVYTLPLAITSNNMAEAYAQYQTHPSTVGISIDLSAMGVATKMYIDCESFYRFDDGNGGYNYETYGEFNDSSLAQQFGFEFQNVNIRLSTSRSSIGTLVGIATINQLASKANSADLATVATSGDYNDLTNKPTIPTAYTLPTATTSTLGGVKVDGSTITIDGNGVISSSASGGSSYTFTNGLTENNGTVSWDLNDRIKAGSGQKSVYINGAYGVSGHYSFAEGEYTRADGNCAHAEGQYAYAVGLYQHAEGRANILDSNSIFQNIAGNGTNNNNRATMFARDWNGNEYLSGNLFVGCNDFTTTANGLTTANAGGSKVATESYVATAIANIPSSGSTPIDFEDGYWSEDNGTYSLDMLAISSYCQDGITTDRIYTNEIDETTGDSVLLEDKLAQIDDALDSIPAPYTLPTATTSTLGGVKVDGTTITITDGVISATSSGGGTTYTAGDGIVIDSNGVISRTDIGLTGMPLFASGFVSNFSFGDTPSASTLSQLAENLKKYGISKYSGDNFTTTALNEAMGGTRYITQFLSGDIVPNLSWSVNTYNSTSNVGSWSWRDTPCFVIGENNKIYGTTSFSKLRMLIGWNLGELIHLNVSQLSNLTTSTDIRRLPNLMSDINNVIGDINTRIPSAPTTDGNYVLKVSVSSGTPTYSWVAET